MEVSSLHVALFPYFAMGHLIPNLRLSNKLARKGYRISLFIPKKTQPKLEHLNLYPHLITFVPITVPHVDGLPHGAETTSDVPSSLFPLIMKAVDRTEKEIELLLRELKPAIVFFDFAFWIPNLTRRLGIKSIFYATVGPVAVAYIFGRRQSQGSDFTEQDLMHPPHGFPDPSIKLGVREARRLAALIKREDGEAGITLFDRYEFGLRRCDAVACRGCREIEGPYIDFLEQVAIPVLLQGPNIPEPPTSALDEKWAAWLAQFKATSVVYCAFGSECILEQHQFQELLLGLELTGKPFLAVLKPPFGYESVEAALPDGFKERVQERGVVHGGWVQQQLILEHPSVGCFITHCGTGSLIEGLVSQCQLVLLPNAPDQIIKSRMLGSSLKVGVEVEKGEEDGLFTKDSVYKAVTTVMDDDSQIGREVRANRAKLREALLRKDLEQSYVDNFCNKLEEISGCAGDKRLMC